MAGGRGRALIVFSAAGITALAAWGQSEEPTSKSDQPQLTAEQLVSQIRQVERELPQIDTTPTEETQAKGVEACKLFKLALSQREKLDQRAMPLLGSLGVRAGFAAGEPEVMISGARLMWETDRLDDKPREQAAYCLAWAGLLAGEPAAGLEAAKFIAENAESTGARDWARQFAANLVNCDKPVTFSFQLLGGANVRIQDHRGKAIVLYFWTSWSAPCRQEMPEIRKFYEERKEDPNFTIVGLSLDRAVAEAQAGIKELGMTWPQAMDAGIRARFEGDTIPYVAIISPTGCILWQGHPGIRPLFHRVADFARRHSARLEERKKQAAQAPEKKPVPSPPTTPAPTATGVKPSEALTPAAQADQKYRLAMAYLETNLREKAKEVLKSIVLDFPDTPAADRAKARLENLP